MQVFDLTQLRSVSNPPVAFSETAHYNGFGRAHNLVINEDSGFAYGVGTNNCSGGLHMVNIQNPISPTNAGCFSGDGCTHDAQCVTYQGPDAPYLGKEICINSNGDTLTIVDVTDKLNPVQLSRTTYAGSEYTHQGWLTEDHTYFLLGDELDEQRNGVNTTTYVWDVSDLDAPSVLGRFENNTLSIDHNQYIKASFAYQANYPSGLRVLDISGVASTSLNEVAYFDIYPASNAAQFNGAWSNYPYFTSGLVVVSGIEQGLFILRPNLGPVDNPPSATITGPVEGATVSGMVTANANANANANDDNGVAQVEFFVGSVSIGVDTTAPYSVPWNSATVPDGSHTVTATATVTIDQTGSDTNNVTVDNVNDPPVAAFTYSCTDLSCDFDASGSSDSDGTIASYSWDFGDGDAGSGVTASHPYAAAGTYPVALTVTDDDGATNAETQSVTVSEAPTTLHLGDIDGSKLSSGKDWMAQITIIVYDENENLVSVATVVGTWSGDTTGLGNCTTDVSGACTFMSGPILKKKTSRAIFTVDSVSEASLTYSAADNHDPDGDSTGTAIQVNKDGTTQEPVVAPNQPPTAVFTYS